MTGKDNSQFDPFNLDKDIFDELPEGTTFQAASSNTSNWNSDSYSHEDSSEILLKTQEEGFADPLQSEIPEWRDDQFEYNDDSEELVSAPEKTKRLVKAISIAAVALLVVGGVTTFVIASTHDKGASSSSQEPAPKSNKTKDFNLVTPTGYLDKPVWMYEYGSKSGDKTKSINSLVDSSGAFIVTGIKGESAHVIETNTGEPRKELIEDYSGQLRPIVYGGESAIAVETESGWSIVTKDDMYQIPDNDSVSVSFSGERMYRTEKSEPKSIFPVTSKAMKSDNSMIRAVAPSEGMIAVSFDESSVIWGSSEEGASLVTADYNGAVLSKVKIAPPADGFSPKHWGSVFGSSDTLYMVWTNAQGDAMISTNSIESGKILASEKFTLSDEGMGDTKVSQDRNLFVIDGRTLINSKTGLVYPVSKSVSIISTFGDTFYIKDGSNRGFLSMGLQTPSITQIEPDNVNAFPLGISGDNLIVTSKHGLSLHEPTKSSK